MNRYTALIILGLFSLPWASKGIVPLQNKVLEPDPAIQAVVDSVSMVQYRNYQVDIESMGLGLYGGSDYRMPYRNRDYHLEKGPSPGNKEASLYIQDAFKDMGLEVTVQGKYANVVGELRGAVSPEKIYIIGAHFDHIEGDMPGGDDNASGTAAVLEIARVLSQCQFESTIRFICFNAEEDGLLGSKDYVSNQLISENETVAGMINLDMILRPGSDVDSQYIIDAELETHTNHEASVAWARAYQEMAAAYVPSLTVNDTIIHFDQFGTDHESFIVVGFPAFLVIENSIPDWEVANPYYHSFEDASDRLSNDPESPSGISYDYAFATDISRASVALLATEAGLLTGPVTRPRFITIDESCHADSVLQVMEIDSVWAGHPVGFCLYTHGNRQYIAYYNARRNMVVGQRNLADKNFELHTMAPGGPESSGGTGTVLGWDSHNYVTIGIDKEGFIHLSGNMHVHPLNYFRSTLPNDISTLVQVPEMVGDLEDKCTYPRFMETREGELLFHYRDGGSGNGNEIYNVYSCENKTWSRMLDVPLTDGQGLMNAYQTQPSLMKDGWYHVYWVWRDTPDCSTNHDLSYMKSPNLKDWYNAFGEKFELPATLDKNLLVVDPIPVKGGIINLAAKLCLDESNKAVFAYHKYDEAGNLQFYTARVSDEKWVYKRITDWDYRWEFSGNGSINTEVRLNGFQKRGDGNYEIDYWHIKYGKGTILLDSEFEVIGKVLKPKPFGSGLEVEGDFPGLSVKTTGDLGQPKKANSRYVLKWETLNSNRDRPRPKPWPGPSRLLLYKLRTTDPAIRAMVDSVSMVQYRNYQVDIESMGQGLYGGSDYRMLYRNRDYHLENGPSPGNKEASLYIQDAFKDMGLEVTVQGKYANVVGELRGTASPGKIYIIGAHFDHLEGDMPGGDDNASGTAAVLEAARVLSQYRFESTIRFICFNAEEDGLLGSKDYVRNHVLPGDENIAGMINLDLILRPGSDVDSLSIIDAELESRSTHEPSWIWAKDFRQAATDYVPSLIVDETLIDGESSSDNDSFLEAGFPAFLVIENSDPDWAEANPYIHTYEDASDRLANNPESPAGVRYDYSFASDITRTAVALLAREAVLLSE